MNDMKISFFDQYCSKCKHFESPETDDPCNECLTYGGNIDSHKPVNFEENEEKKGSDIYGRHSSGSI